VSTPPEWLQTRRGRREFLAVAVFVLLFVAVPLWRTELYPFSRAPMFADAPQRYCNYTVLGPDGQPLDLRDFGLQRNYWGNPLGVGVGFRPAETIDHFGEVPEKQAVIAHVADRLARHPGLKYVEVVREVIGPLESGRIGLVQTDRWRIDNPHHGRASGS
jgi:hypothetical protein